MTRNRNLTTAAAGAAAASAWIAAEPLARRACGTGGYSVVRLLGRPLARRRWRAAGIALHLANGAAAAIVFDRAGFRGWKPAVAAFQLEGAVTWPGMALADRVHPDRRSEDWPPLFRNPSVFAHEAFGHLVFGLVLGLLLRDE
jgi:hypothetical protein